MRSHVLMLYSAFTQWNYATRNGQPETRFTHYSDVIMSAMVSQITDVSIVCSTDCSGANQRKHQSSAPLGLCEGNPPVTGGFPSQRASNTGDISIWWRHHDPIRCLIIRSRETWDTLSYHTQEHRQQSCRNACQISRRLKTDLATPRDFCRILISY